MAWLYKQKDSANWWLGYRHNGKQVLRSTKTSDDTLAEAQRKEVEYLFEKHRTGSITEELIEALTGKSATKVTLAAEVDSWLADRRGATSEKTIVRYESFAKEFKAAMNATEAGPLLSRVTTSDIQNFLNAKRQATSASTANLARKTLSAIFIRAVKHHRLRENPVSPIDPQLPKKGEKVKRRAYSVEELACMYDKSPDDFWRYMVLGGFYTGLRMGDLICLNWGAVDLQKGQLVLNDDKTDKPMRIPIAKPLRAILATIRASAGKVKPTAFVWPDQAARYQEKGSGIFSSEFYKSILTPCGLVTPRTASHKATGAGRGVKRITNEVSFHSLRHSFVTFLVSSGSNQAVAKELAGHASDTVNALYTHVPESDLTKAIGQLPEFVK